MIYSYRRVSTDEQYNGPQAQTDIIQRWIKSQEEGGDGSKDYFDNGVSGSVPLADRPQGALIIDALSSGDTVVVAKLDRLFRSVSDAASTIETWNNFDVKIVAISEGFDMTNPYGRAMCQMASVFAELERAMIRQRTKDALASKKSRGERLGSVPYGYDCIDKKLVGNAIEQDVLQGIHRMSESGHGPTFIAGHLNSMGVKAKNGGSWHKTQVIRCLRNFDSKIP